MSRATRVLIRTAVGRVVRKQVERTLFTQRPGYNLFQSLTHRLAGDSDEQAWQTALVELEGPRRENGSESFLVGDEN